MNRDPHQLRDDALAIWKAGVDAVASDRLVHQYLRIENRCLLYGDQSVALDDFRDVVVVGAGKAGAGMAAAIEEVLADHLGGKQLRGCVNVPEDCLRPLRWIQLHPARPAGLNEPTADGVRGAEKIVRLVQEAQPEDLCICLISGGGSALMPAPVEGISLADKQQLTRLLSAAGADIEQLNTVRKALSRIKGGGLARQCGANRLITLIISDVLGDPLDVIASGPTVPSRTGPADALRVLEKFDARAAGVGEHVFRYLQKASRQPPPGPSSVVQHHAVIGNNALAVDAAGMEAERRGYSHAMTSANQSEGLAEDVGRHLWKMAERMKSQPGPDCLITGGEPVVELVPSDVRGRGGRNQQLVLAALQAACAEDDRDNPLAGLLLLSGGTDGEDGPTDAAGALIEEETIAKLANTSMDIDDYLRRNDAYEFFQRLDSLIKTGPTHTNVCDLRVVVVSRD